MKQLQDLKGEADIQHTKFAAKSTAPWWTKAFATKLSKVPTSIDSQITKLTQIKALSPEGTDYSGQKYSKFMKDMDAFIKEMQADDCTVALAKKMMAIQGFKF